MINEMACVGVSASDFDGMGTFRLSFTFAAPLSGGGEPIKY